MFKSAMTVVGLSLLSSSLFASEVAKRTGGAPKPMELQALVQSAWSGFSRVLYVQDRLVDPPTRLVRLPQALCRVVLAQTYECVSLVEYELANGTQRSAFLRHSVQRDDQGKLLDVIVVRETPTPQSLQGVR